MALDLKAVQVRLPEEAYDALALIATAQDKDLGEVLREIAVEALLGKAHAIRLAADRLARAVMSGKDR